MDDIAILLVDSAAASLVDLAALLQRHGYRTQRVTCASDALVTLEAREPSLVFVGLAHPEATQICGRLRDTAVGAITPVILMGSHGGKITCVAEALAVGADFYFDAPWADDAVLTKVKTYVGEGGVPMVDGLPTWPQASANAVAPKAAPPPLPAEPTTDLTALIQPPTMLAQQGPPPRRKPGLLALPLPCKAGSWEAALPAGKLDPRCHVAHVLAQAWAAQASGRMDWRQGDIHVCLWFYEGSPCGYSSNLAHDNLAEFLSRTGSIRQAAYRQLRLQTLPSARLALAYLMRLGEISSDKIWPLLTAHLAEQSYGLFAWENGTFAWHNDVMPLEERITLNIPTPGWLLEGIRRKYDMPRLAHPIGGPASLIARHAASEALVPNLHLGRSERQMIGLLDGTRTLEDIASSCRAQLVEVYRLVLLLVLLRHAQVATRGPIEQQPAVGVNATRDAQRIAEKLQQARLCDYFEILGIGVDASGYEVDRAAGTLQAAFHPSKFNQDLRADYAADLAEIAEIIADAREVLADPSKRQAYAEQVV